MSKKLKKKTQSESRNNIIIGLVAFSVAVWSELGGQNDIKWDQAANFQPEIDP